MSSPLSSAELENLGVIFIGFVTTTVLYGLTFFQTYIYYTRYPRDPQWIKYLVVAICTLDTAASALICEVLYYYLIILFDVNLDVFYASTTFCIQYLLSVILTFISSLFFTHRVFQVTGKSRLVTVALVFLSGVALVFGLVASAQMFTERQLSTFGSLHMEVTAATGVAAGVVANIIVFVTMSYSLNRTRHSQVTLSDGFLVIVSKVFVSRGLMFTLAQAAYVCVFLAAPSRQLWVPFQMVASKIYINTLLGQLNARRMWQGQGLNEEESLAARKASTNSRLPTIRLNATDLKATTQSVKFVTSEQKDAESTVTDLDSKRTYDQLGNEYSQLSTGSSQSQTDEAIKTCLSVD